VGSPVVDMVYEPDLAGFDPAYPAVIVATEDDRIAGYSVDPSNFGTKIFEEQFPAGIRGVTIDQVPDLAFVALETGVIQTYDFKADEHLAETTVAGNVQRLRLDPVTSNLYATFDSETDGAVGLRIYATREGVTELRSYVLDAGATSLDLDTSQGLVYVGHRTTGMSVVDPVAGTVARASAASFGADIEGVAVDPGKGLIYASSSSGQPAPVVVIGRQQAPRIVTSPSAVKSESGASVTFEAEAFGVPSPTVRWESRRAGTTAWSTVSGATDTTLALTAGTTNTQYRAVFSNTIGGEVYETSTTSATLTVPGGEEPPTEPGEGPSEVPAPIDEKLLTDANRGGVTVQLEGSVLTVKVGADAAGDWVGTYLHSTPTFLGWQKASGSAQVTHLLPAGTVGNHKVVVLDAEGNLLGWAPLRINDSGALASTGAPLEAPLYAGLALLVVGGIALALRLRRPADAR